MRLPNRIFAAGGLALTLSAPAAFAQDDLLAGELRKELDSIREDYEARIRRLESRIAELEKKSAPAPGHNSPAPPAKPAAPAPPATPPPETAFEAAADESIADDDRQRQLDAAWNTFRGTTESRDLALRADAERKRANRIESVLEGHIDISGYFRAGYGRGDDGGPQQAFGLPGVSKYRLGNEAENYGELLFSKTFFTPGSFSLEDSGGDISGPVARMNLRLAFYNPYENYGSGSDTDFSFPELWTSVANIIPGHPEAKIWAGSRFYRRFDIHINDYFFWDMSGGGGGIEDLELGQGKLAFAWIGDGAGSTIYDTISEPDPLNEAGFSKSNFDLRYYDWPLFGGQGEVGLTYSHASSGVDSTGRRADSAHGAALGLVRTKEGFLDPYSLHRTSLQIGNGPAKTFSSGFDTFTDATGTYIRPDPTDSWRFRATDHWIVKPWECVSLGSALVYQYTDFGPGAPEQHWLSGGVRPIIYFNQWASLAFEAGVDWISESASGNSGTLGKFTIAPQISVGDQFLSRPVIRTFLTYALWNEGMEGQVGGPGHANDTAGWSWGVQMESWW